MIKVINNDKLNSINEIFDCLVIQTAFRKKELNDINLITQDNEKVKQTIHLIDTALSFLKNGGLLYTL